ncbi:ATP-dependent RNA helicase HrpA [Conexibacter sp. DBS9H8]|uniref:ATP-dependent RNA helicase HrpA n=1 Tax=Conexibacter sp. DBS9H8 TaxID=2937801 RepID=UPI0020102B71|nr:ATP-dependent RNA helicase HrpA [Conexibacter sp. DBS9H8]
MSGPITPGLLAELTLQDEVRLGRQARRVRASDRAGQERLAHQLTTAQARVRRRRESVPAIHYQEELPVSARREELAAAIAAHPVVIVAGETGSGKTTQLPKICLELGRGVRGTIAHTQPRRIAARTVAQRIAEELGVPLGSAVGYAIRFDDRGSADTLVRLVTDGLLLAEIRRDPLLRRYDTVIVDEAHERSLNIDFLLGCLHRILPRRPDLKLIITSATIDPERFSDHFGGAPIIEVSGRTHPVEVRYRPLGGALAPGPADDVPPPVAGAGPAARPTHPDGATEPGDDPADRSGAPGETLLDALADTAVDLLAEQDGDILVFLSGEREIRDAAELLGGRLGPEVEILSLYSRLAAAQQQRVFAPDGGGRPRRRVVLATNVAETSVTVPGIRAVIDTGLARISRYSARLKVQRLPVEAISQASAQQRAGRCGRLGPGICVRLYSEEDFNARPRYTDPEILRTNLASVILQMAALSLGEIEGFPFLEAPDRRQIRDGIALLHELGALDPAAPEPLTPLGRRLARLPVDPRLGRMVLEADRLRCAREVIVIVAALSIQDPRERPIEQRAQADQLHARFRDPGSDFLAYLNLWRHLSGLERELSRSQFVKRCRAELLHYLRIREWQDLVSQLEDAATEVGVTLNDTPAEAAEIHTALLAGLLSHLGMRDGNRREYLGARGARFAIFPGSVLARRGPSWVMVAELVETSRLWGRTAAAVDVRRVEALAGHLVKRSYGEPRWDRRRAAVIAPERVTLYGLALVNSRPVPYGRIDPASARELFIRRAIVDGDWDQAHAFMAENARRIEAVEALEARARRRDLLADEASRAAFLEQRIPPEIVGGREFDRWWRQARAAEPDRLTYPMELLIAGETPPDDAGRPARWRQGEREFALSYRFDPGSAADGVTVHIPLTQLGAVADRGFEWLVPAFRAELYETLLRSLPKPLRRPLVPIPDTARALLAHVTPRSGPLLEVLAAGVAQLTGVSVSPADWNLDTLPSHLRMTFAVEDDDERLLASGTSLQALRTQLAPTLRTRLDASMPELMRTGMTGFDLPALPRIVELPGGLRGYPAFQDTGDSVAIRICETPAEQRLTMARGTRRLLSLTVPSPRHWLSGRLGPQLTLRLAGAPHGGLDAVLEDVIAAAIDLIVTRAGGPAWSAEAFAVLAEQARGELRPAALAGLTDLGEILAAAHAVRARLDALPASAALAPAREDVARQLGRLVFAGMVTAAGVERLPDITRYLTAAAQRLDRLPQQVRADAERMANVQALEAQAAGRPELRWLVEEVRVTQLVPGSLARPGASLKRLRQLLAEPVPPVHAVP